MFIRSTEIKQFGEVTRVRHGAALQALGVLFGEIRRPGAWAVTVRAFGPEGREWRAGKILASQTGPVIELGREG